MTFKCPSKESQWILVPLIVTKKDRSNPKIVSSILFTTAEVSWHFKHGLFLAEIRRCLLLRNCVSSTRKYLVRQTRTFVSHLLIHTPALWLISGERASPCRSTFPPTVATKSISVYPHFPTKCNLLGFTFHLHSITAL